VEVPGGMHLTLPEKNRDRAANEFLLGR
jgi:hypothetical protein